MSDQYTPPGTTTITSRPDPYRSDVRVEIPSTAAPAAAPSESGFGTGMLVAAVFVVIAVIAAAIFSNRDAIGTGSGVTPPGVTIENNVAPADPVAPAEVVPAPTAPQPVPAPEVVDPVVPVPDTGTAQPAVPAAPVNP